jgi:hypothetical protein
LKIFTRSKHITCDKTADNLLETRSALVDTVHEMEVLITTDIEKREIIAASAEILRAPYLICAEAALRVNNLAGLSIDRKKITSAINELVGGPLGCAHLIDITLDAVKVIKQSLYVFVPGEFEERMRTFDGLLRNSCYAHSQALEEKIKTHLSANVITERKK